MYRNLLLSSFLNMTYNQLKKFIYLFAILILFGCKTDIELSMERGIHYFELNDIDKSILQFKYIIHKLGPKTNDMSYKNIKLLAQAHHNLAVAYAKHDPPWNEEAIQEAQKAFDLIPSKRYKQVLDKIIINKK